MRRPLRPRTLRKPFVASIVITDLMSEQQVSTRTRDLSEQGCFAATTNPFKPGVKVRIAIAHAGAKVVASGLVVSARADGMSITFTKIEQSDVAVLEHWLSAWG